MADMRITIIILDKDVPDFMEKMLVWKPNTSALSDDDWIRKCVVDTINSKYSYGLISRLPKADIVK